MLVFRKILCTYIMDDPQIKWCSKSETPSISPENIRDSDNIRDFENFFWMVASKVISKDKNHSQSSQYIKILPQLMLF